MLPSGWKDFQLGMIALPLRIFLGFLAGQRLQLYDENL
jgi:hypothetical protein